MEENKCVNITLRKAIDEIVWNYEIEYLTFYFIQSLYDLTSLTDEDFRDTISVFVKLTKSLTSLPFKETDCLIVLDVYYYDDNDESCLVYDAYYTLPNDSEKHSLELMDWADVIDARIASESIDNYGLLNVVIKTLNSLTLYGYDYETAKNNSQEIKNNINNLL